MPSVGSTPTTTSPAQQSSQHQHPKLQQQHSLPLQLQQYQQQQQQQQLQQQQQNYHHQQQQQQSQSQQASAAAAAAQHVTTTQPSPAGVINSTTSSSGIGISNGGDMSPMSSSNSFSSVDTNQTLLNSIANHAQQQQQHHHQQQQQQHQLQKQRTTSTSSSGRGATTVSSSNRMYNTKYSQFMIITPAVSIDRDFEHQSTINNSGTIQHYDDASSYCNNGNIFRTSLLQSSIDSGNSSDSSGGGSFRSNYNPYLHNSRQHLLSKTTAPHSFYTFSSSSWRWCTLICAAMRCFGGSRSSTNAPPPSVFTRPPYQRSRSSGGGHHHQQHRHATHRRLRPSTSFTAETAFEHFSAPFATTPPRKTRDHLNNITYEL